MISIILFLFLAFPASSLAGVSEHVLENGLKVLITEDHTAPIAVFQIWYRVGSRDEQAGMTGMSHLLEHMMFKGTKKFGPSEISRLVKRYGGTDNAFTSKEYTAYYQILPSDRIELSMQIESERMQNLLMDEQETVSERNVVMEERRLRSEDDPHGALYENVVATAFKVHPYRWPVIGWMSDLGNIRRADLYRHYRAYYRPGNAFVVVAGDVDTGAVLAMIRKYFGGIRQGAGAPALKRVEPPQRGERRVYLRKEAELPYVIAAYHVPSLPDEDGYALEVLTEILSGKSGRLYRRLIYDRQIAQNADAGYSGLTRDPYLYFLDATAAPGVAVEEVEEALYAVLDALKDEGPTEFELQRAKNRVEAAYIMGQDSLFNQAMQIGRFEIAGDWRMKDAYVEGVRRVGAGDVSRVAAKYLVRDNRTVGILVPESRGGQ